MYIKTSDQPELELGFGNYNCNWGVHIAGLYETPEERDEILFGFFSAGYRNNDLDLFCPDERTTGQFREELVEFCPDCKKDINDPGHFTFKSAKEFYYPQGVFSPFEMDKSLDSFFEESQKNGERNVRGSAVMSWALKSIPGIEHLMAYESRLNRFIPEKPWISICLYDINLFDGKMIMNVLRTHPYTISKGIITQNPLYQDPEIWLKENAPQFL